MDDGQFELLLPIATASLRLSALSLSAQLRAGQLSRLQREQAAQALDELRSQLELIARKLGIDPFEIASARCLADELRAPDQNG